MASVQWNPSSVQGEATRMPCQKVTDVTRSTRIRTGALLAIAGGALRTAASFAPTLLQSDLGRESLYIVVDACFAAGLLAFASLRPRRLGRWGSAGLALTLAGIATVRANRQISTTDLYPAGALAIAFGVIALSVTRGSSDRFAAGCRWRSSFRHYWVSREPLFRAQVSCSSGPE
jgi:hypothetical protein